MFKLIKHKKEVFDFRVFIGGYLIESFKEKNKAIDLANRLKKCFERNNIDIPIFALYLFGDIQGYEKKKAIRTLSLLCLDFLKTDEIFGIKRRRKIEEFCNFNHAERMKRKEEKEQKKEKIPING